MSMNVEYRVLVPKIKPYTVYLTPYTQHATQARWFQSSHIAICYGSFYIHSYTGKMQIRIQTQLLQMQRTRFILTCPTYRYRIRNRTAALYMHASCPWPQETGDNAQWLDS